MGTRDFYNTILCLTFSPCGNFLVAGDVYGKISVLHLQKIMSPTNVQVEPRIKNSFVVQKDFQINSLLATDDYLVVGVFGEIYGYNWNLVKTNKDAKAAWKLDIGARDSLEKVEVNCMVSDNNGLIYAGCGDNNIYVFDIETRMLVRSLVGHSDYIHSIFCLNHELASGGEDGSVYIWDLRDRVVINKLQPFENDSIARPELGKWIGAVGFNDDWLICGGGPKLSLWHFRSMTRSTIFPIDDRGIHVAEVLGDKILAGGTSEHFYNMSYNGDIIAKIPISGVTVYAAVHQEQPFPALCIAGSSPKIDICSKLNYIDHVVSLM